MGKLFFIPVLILAGFLCVSGQTAEKCSEITINGAPRGYLTRGQQYFLSVAVKQITNEDWENLKYEWSFSRNIPFEGQGQPAISFIAHEEFDGSEVKATVKIEGLPESCENTFSETFGISFNPGTPVMFERYEKLAFSQEKIKLDNVVSKLKEYDEKALALFIIRFDRTETKTALRLRILKISDYLMTKHKLPKDKFNFVFVKDDEALTQIYLAHKSIVINEPDWEEGLEKLFEKQSKKSR